MTRGDTPCSALTFIRNSMPSLKACLDSCQFCREHVLLDGGSTDGSLELAAEYGCRVVPQDKKYLNAEGRIIDFGAMTNQGIAETKEPWIMITDSDEYLDAALIAEMQRIIREHKVGAYYVNRRYTYEGREVEYASGYPNWQIRLWHRDAINGFIKIVHERPDLKPGVVAQVLPGIQFVPLDPVDVLRRKYERYLALEVSAEHDRRAGHWFYVVWNKNIRIAARLFRMAWNRLLHPKSLHLPLSYEWLNIWYAWQIILRTNPFTR